MILNSLLKIRLLRAGVKFQVALHQLWPCKEEKKEEEEDDGTLESLCKARGREVNTSVSWAIFLILCVTFSFLCHLELHIQNVSTVLFFCFFIYHLVQGVKSANYI